MSTSDAKLARIHNEFDELDELKSAGELGVETLQPVVETLTATSERAPPSGCD